LRGRLLTLPTSARLVIGAPAARETAALSGADGTDGVPDREERLEGNHRFGVFRVIASEREDFLDSHVGRRLSWGISCHAGSDRGEKPPRAPGKSRRFMEFFMKFRGPPAPLNSVEKPPLGCSLYCAAGKQERQEHSHERERGRHGSEHCRHPSFFPLFNSATAFGDRRSQHPRRFR